jgi:hypothetical protein
MGEIDGLSVDENQVYLRMGHTDGFDGVLDGGGAVEQVGEARFPFCRREEVVEFLVKPECGGMLGHGFGFAHDVDFDILNCTFL